MARGARVRSVQEVAAFRAFLVELAETVRHGVGEADAQVRRTERWLKQDLPAELSAAQHKAARALEAARDDLRRKRLQPTATGAPASVQAEQKALSRVKEAAGRLAQRGAAARRWAAAFDREVTEYRGATQPARDLPNALIPRACAKLEAHLVALEDYLQAGGAGRPPENSAGSAESVARPVADDAVSDAAGPAPDKQAKQAGPDAAAADGERGPA